MPNTISVTMVLTGPRKGWSENINGHYFHNGVYKLVGQEDRINPCIKFLATYGAYPEGSKEYHAACDNYEKIMKEQNGLSNIQESTEPGATTEVLSSVQSGRKGSSSEKTAKNKPTDKINVGEEGVHSSGTRHEHSRLSTKPETESGESNPEKCEKSKTPVEGMPELNKKLLQAIKSLNAEDDDHWVKTGKNAGKPKISVVEEAYGETGITRIDIESAAPDYDKNAALEILISNL